jgi:hypothetical protein
MDALGTPPTLAQRTQRLHARRCRWVPALCREHTGALSEEEFQAAKAKLLGS